MILRDMGKRKSLQERFESKVQFAGPDDCWEWQANKNNKGYGMIRQGGLLPKVLAHRVSYELYREIVPKGLCVLHTCDNPGCVNPYHLWLGTKKENVADMYRKNRANRPSMKGIGKPPTFYGQDHPSSKLTNEQVIEIRKRSANGETDRGLAREYSLDKSTIRSLRLRKGWAHI